MLLSAKKTDVAEKLRLLSLAEHKLRLAKTAGSVALLQLGDVYYQKTKITLPVDFADVVNAVKCYKGVMDSPSSPTELCRSLLQTLKLYYRYFLNKKKNKCNEWSSHVTLPHYLDTFAIMSTYKENYSVRRFRHWQRMILLCLQISIFCNSVSNI